MGACACLRECVRLFVHVHGRVRVNFLSQKCHSRNVTVSATVLSANNPGKGSPSGPLSAGWTGSAGALWFSVAAHIG